ncbi:unnamed protein product [Schistocephalus solidus]|uniref:Calcium-binding protein n=1 Tax=Schistocephalus solidus TaxID=70667 RepID=A0A183SK48_SCHSO|nr:unnamed protein product [Schistocephalus solidus]
MLAADNKRGFKQLSAAIIHPQTLLCVIMPNLFLWLFIALRMATRVCPTHDFDFDGLSVGGEDSDAVQQQTHHPAELPGEEIRKWLRTQFDQIDTSKDAQLDRTELRTWLSKLFRDEDIRSAQEILERIDRNGDRQVSFDEYIIYTFGYSVEDLDRLSKDETTDAKNLISTIEEERQKFHLADLDGDGGLKAEELAGFQNPFHYEHMAPYAANETIQHLDKNGDGQLSRKEYVSSGR